MKRPNPEHIDRLRALVNACPYFTLLSMEIREIGIGWAVLEIPLAEKHLQPFGIAHGGVFASLIDAVTFWSIYFSVEDPSTAITSVDLKLNYLAPAATGTLVARGRQVKLGRTLGLAEAEVFREDGKLLAQGTSTVMLIPGKGLGRDGSLPPKFLG